MIFLIFRIFSSLLILLVFISLNIPDLSSYVTSSNLSILAISQIYRTYEGSWRMLGYQIRTISARYCTLSQTSFLCFLSHLGSSVSPSNTSRGNQQWISQSDCCRISDQQWMIYFLLHRWLISSTTQPRLSLEGSCNLQLISRHAHRIHSMLDLVADTWVKLQQKREIEWMMVSKFKFFMQLALRRKFTDFWTSL